MKNIEKDTEDYVGYPFKHPQVDSGYGFTCDVDVLPVIKAVWNIDFKTVGSCQHWNEDQWPTLFERYVGIVHDDLHELLDFAIYLKNSQRSGGHSYYQQMMFQWGTDIWLSLHYRPNDDLFLLDIINRYADKGVNDAC